MINDGVVHFSPWSLSSAACWLSFAWLGFLLAELDTLRSHIFFWYSPPSGAIHLLDHPPSHSEPSAQIAITKSEARGAMTRLKITNQPLPRSLFLINSEVVFVANREVYIELLWAPCSCGQHLSTYQSRMFFSALKLTISKPQQSPISGLPAPSYFREARCFSPQAEYLAISGPIRASL